MESNGSVEVEGSSRESERGKGRNERAPTAASQPTSPAHGFGSPLLYASLKKASKALILVKKGSAGSKVRNFERRLLPSSNGGSPLKDGVEENGYAKR